MTAIGIDLGTTYSCVAAVHKKEVKVFQNDQGHTITPSCVAFTDEQRLIGEPALHNMLDDPENTIYSVKRIIGKQYDDAIVQQDIATWPFQVVRDTNGKPIIKALYKNQEKSFYPHEISATVLQEMKLIAEKRLETDVYNAVITVPAYFTHAQRVATENAAEIAGLNILRTINEPTAAAICWGMLKNYSTRKNVLVYDLGGGTFDVTVLTIERENFKVKASTGDTHLGGDDFRNAIVCHLVDEMKRKFGKDVSNNVEAMARLREESERVKKELSFSRKERIKVRELHRGITLDSSLTQTKFNDLNKHYFDKTMDLVQDALVEAGMQKSNIHDVVLVGGSTRIPRVKDILKQYFGADKIRESTDPDETVARGAAIYAAHLTGDTIPDIGGVNLSDITPLSLGVELIGDLTSVLIKRNSSLPIEAEGVFHNVEDNQKYIFEKVCQGEARQFSRNEYLGGFDLPLPPKKKGEANVHVRFQLNLNGILNVTAWEESVGEVRGIDITMRGRLDNSEIHRLQQQFEKMRREDNEFESRQRLLQEVDNLIDDVRSRCEDPSVLSDCTDLENWVNQNPKASLFELKRRMKELEISEENA